MIKELSKEEIMNGRDIVSAAAVIIPLFIKMRKIGKCGSATNLEVLNVLLNGIAIGILMERFNYYLDKKLKEMEEKKALK